MPDVKQDLGNKNRVCTESEAALFTVQLFGISS